MANNNIQRKEITLEQRFEDGESPIFYYECDNRYFMGKLTGLDDNLLYADDFVQLKKGEGESIELFCNYRDQDLLDNGIFARNEFGITWNNLPVLYRRFLSGNETPLVDDLSTEELMDICYRADSINDDIIKSIKNRIGYVERSPTWNREDGIKELNAQIEEELQSLIDPEERFQGLEGDVLRAKLIEFITNNGDFSLYPLHRDNFIEKTYGDSVVIPYASDQKMGILKLFDWEE